MGTHRAKKTDDGAAIRPATTKPVARISRRVFLWGGAIVTLGIGALSGALLLQPTLRALVDTIIPADEFGPSASDTGADDAIWASVQDRLSERMKLRAALAWLNIRAGGSYAGASEDNRLALLLEIAQRPASDKLRRFYDWVRVRTMRHYYGDASRAAALGFVGPPQPHGHPDAASPWKVPS